MELGKQTVVYKAVSIFPVAYKYFVMEAILVHKLVFQTVPSRLPFHLFYFQVSTGTLLRSLVTLTSAENFPLAAPDVFSNASPPRSQTGMRTALLLSNFPVLF